jgi:hypothetical protein
MIWAPKRNHVRMTMSSILCAVSSRFAKNYDGVKRRSVDMNLHPFSVVLYFSVNFGIAKCCNLRENMCDTAWTNALHCCNHDAKLGLSTFS